MNTTMREAVSLVAEMRDRLDALAEVEKAVFPPFVSLHLVREALEGSSVRTGAQNMYFEEKGAFTGEISPLMLKGLCDYVIIGHSERRAYFHESDELVNKKTLAALHSGIKPVICVGEHLEQNEAGMTEEVVGRQVLKALQGVGPQDEFVIAYEPVWAIGTGRAATCDQAQATISFIREKVAGVLGRSAGERLRILYGGSVTTGNISDMMNRPDIDGALVGGASLKAGDFVIIVERAATAKTR